MPFVLQKRIMAIALESTAGTTGTMTSAFNIRLRDIQFDPEIESYIRWFATGRHSKAGAVMGKKKATVSCKHDLSAGVAVGTAPTSRKLFIACGANETIVSSTSVDYTPDISKDHGNNINATIQVMDIPVSGNALIYTMKGAMGNMVVTMDELGQPLTLNPTFTGAFTSIGDGTALVLSGADTSVPPAVLGATITHAGSAQKIGKFSFDWGNQIEMEFDPADSTGYLAAYIAKREPKITINPQASLVATDGHYTRWAAGTEGAFSLATAAVSSIRWTITAPKAQLLTNKPGDRNGSLVYEQEYELHEATGSDEWMIKQSA